MPPTLLFVTVLPEIIHYYEMLQEAILQSPTTGLAITTCPVPEPL